MIQQGSQEWLNQRKGRITASNVGAILRHNPYRKREDVMRAMVRDALGAPSEFDGNIATRYGNANEQNACFEFELETGLSTQEAPFVEFEDWAGASVDRWVGDDAFVEFKAPFSLRKDPNPVFKKLREQEYYWDQVQFQSFCVKRDKFHFYQWSPHGSDWTVARADYEWRDNNIPKLRQFYAEYLHERDNNADEHLAARRVMLDSPEAHGMVREYDELVEQMAWLDERKKDLLSDMVRIAGEKDAEFAGRKLTKVVKEGAVSWAKLSKEHCPTVDTKPYRGKPSEYWRLS